ncbi:hypothetical protein A4D02_32270 [Niastella koreensis]|uniref:Uncharacterized protein n=2 Tax=Niastella koreensis TaxID=354356 RepID=G8TBY5_NIAKG|nr:hypothetical protein [Niastella koreensis]AEV99278.1 hypothetical protein Niako_2947 [Niastella koreensis GR20-10]OQP46067.1 hypothetical protein A4D02_32270 [Niastella koreensis]
MKKILFFLVLVCLDKALQAQYVYTIKADSVKITNSCDTAELIIENHTQTVPGFLFNKGRGRTEFRRGLLRFNDSVFVIGGDTLRMNPWLQGGNRFGTTGTFGTMDNNSIDFYTNGLKRGRLTYEGNWLLGNIARDDGNVLQLGGGRGAITFNPILSRIGDRIAIGGWLNQEDGQNYIIRVSSDNGFSYRVVLYERDGLIAFGDPSLTGSSPFRIFPGGLVNISSGAFFMGTETGAYNTSQLKMFVSDPAEFSSGFDAVHNPDNYYFLGTSLTGITNNNVRANLRLSGRQLHFYSGLGTGAEAGRFTEAGNLLIGSTTDNGDKLQVIGNVFANGNRHRLGNLAIVSGNDVGTSGFATGIRVDNPSNGSLIFEGTNQGWANDMFVFTDAYGGLGQDIYNPDQSIIRIKSGIRSNNVAGNSASMLNIQPEYKLDPASNPLIIRGIYYKPTLTNIISGSKHIAIETVTGDVLLGTTSGNTGIGTNAPTAQLHTTGSVRFSGLTNNNSLTRIVVSDASGNLYYKDAASTFNGAMNSDLAVNGTVSAQKMLISQTGRWPDYVFSKKYQLPSLAEVENFINQNNHLPGIPSAAEVEKKGIDVASNQAGLLKKIEELILYAIEQEKKLQKQSGKIMELNEEINELKNQNKEMESLKQQIAELRTLIISASQSKKIE